MKARTSFGPGIIGKKDRLRALVREILATVGIAAALAISHAQVSSEPGHAKPERVATFRDQYGTGTAISETANSFVHR